MFERSGRRRIIMYAVIAVMIADTIITRQLFTGHRLISGFLGLQRALIYLILFMMWGHSVRRRIIQPVIRRYLEMIALLINFWIVIRTCKYELVGDIPSIENALWYVYYIPLILMPLMGFFVSICLGRNEQYVIPPQMRLLYLPAAAIIAGILTNNYHQLAFRFNYFVLHQYYSGKYVHGPLYFIAFAWIAGLTMVSLAIMLRRSHVPHSRTILWLPFIAFGTGISYTVLYILNVPFIGKFLGDMPAVLSVITVMIWESCIQCGLIQSNSNYDEFFRVSGIDAQIINNKFDVCYASDNAARLDEHVIRSAMTAPVHLDADTVLYCSPVSGGYMLWKDDISTVNLMLGELRRVGERLAESNSLLDAEIRLKKQSSAINEQNRLYDSIAGDLDNKFEKLEHLLKEAGSGDADVSSRLFMVCVIGVYVKRRTNLILLGAEKNMISVSELYLSIRESLEYLRIREIASALDTDGNREVSSGHIELAYDIFEETVENALPLLESVMVSVSADDSGLRMNIMMDGASEMPRCDNYAGLAEQLGGRFEASATGSSAYVTLSLPSAAEGE